MRQRIRLLCALIALSLFFAPIVAGCGSVGHSGSHFYYVTSEGIKVACDPNGASNLGDCGRYGFYESDNGKTYGCSIALVGSYCNEDNPITPVATTSVMQSPATGSPSAGCKPHWVYDQVTDGGTAWYVVDTVLDTNPTSVPSQAKLSATTAKTVTVSDEKQVSSNTSLNLGDVIAFAVRNQINHTATTSLQVTIGNEITVPLPAHQTIHGIYGARVQLASGHLYDSAKCEGVWDYGTDLTTVPYAVGWYYWYDGDATPTTVN